MRRIAEIGVANHVSAFCQRVGMLTFLGRVNSQEDFIRGKLAANVEGIFLQMEGNAPTILKRRFVEHYPLQKLFELYEMEDDGDNPSNNQALCSELEAVLPQYDLVIVTDYGHGMLGAEAVEILCSQARSNLSNTSWFSACKAAGRLLRAVCTSAT